MTTIHHAPKDLAESLQALEAVTLPADLLTPLGDVLRSLDSAQDADEVNTFLAEAGGITLGLQLAKGVSREQAKHLNAIFEALASHVRRVLVN
ncbi:hypothetical protein RBE51_02575 [Pseudomonas taiwanensis]|uniref:hypothetical protein n=1 Tax=Pseudomonas taiwanensis TaxID=470150 RepID=UPI0028DE224B|nr:hypothetical protein [Pseudomonas taiwanensis]MDT8921727.1 hypothetical protein [Pseudomonas taiwanensis]